MQAGAVVLAAIAILFAVKRFSGSPSAASAATIASLPIPGDAARDTRSGTAAIAATTTSPAAASPASDATVAAPPASTGPILISTALEWQAPMRNYPRPDTFSYQGNAMEADYAPDSLLNARINVYLQRYRPETGVIMIADLRSGHVLGIGERQDSLITATPKLAYGAGGFPAASLIKILTATAALESKAHELTDSIPQLGGYHTLYKRQLKTEGQHRLPKITLEEAFSRSVNPAFGMLGLSMGPGTLRNTALRMGFNQSGLPACVAKSRIEFPDSGFSLAETACGFTTKTTISPWHALQIARGVGDDGRLRPCSFPKTILNLATGKRMPPAPDTGSQFISPENLSTLQGYMQATVRVGTARKGFHSVLKASHLDKLEAGGKTGSLDGEETRGRFDWFVGYVKLKDEPSQGIAISIMLVHREYSSIHASQLAALLIRDWLIAHEKAAKAKALKLREAEVAYRDA